MATEAFAWNRLAEERQAAGIATAGELARRARIDPVLYARMEAGEILPDAYEFQRILDVLRVPPERLYRRNYTGVIGSPVVQDFDFSKHFGNYTDPERLLLAPDEVSWLEKRVTTDRPASVMVNLSCGTQKSPHLLQDTVSVLDALGVDFVAVAGRAACCGKVYKTMGRPEAHTRIRRTTLAQIAGLGAQTHVNWCTACQTTLTAEAARQRASGLAHPVREVQVLTFLAETIEALGDRVPWKKDVKRRVLAEGHGGWSAIHVAAWAANERLLRLLPGIEVIGRYDGFSPESPCAHNGPEPDTPKAWPVPQTVEEVRERRAYLADALNARGADTIACQHQGCHQMWSAYASDRLAVRHAVSLVAEALDVAHPDRFQAASQLGDPRALVEQTRPIWQAWGMSEDKALQLATKIADPKFSDAATQCGCGGSGPCNEDLIAIDVLSGSRRSF